MTNNINQNQAAEEISPSAAIELAGAACEGSQTPSRGYKRPEILSHSGEGILEELGPAQACYPYTSCGISV